MLVQQIVEVGDDRDLADRAAELAVLDQEAARAAREVAGDRVEAEAHHRRSRTGRARCRRGSPRAWSCPFCRMKFDVVSAARRRRRARRCRSTSARACAPSRRRRDRSSSTPSSTTTFLREASPSPSYGREPGARAISGSSTMVHQRRRDLRALAAEEVARLAPDGAAGDDAEERAQRAPARLGIEHHRQLAGLDLLRAELRHRAPRRLAPDLLGDLETSTRSDRRSTRSRCASCRRRRRRGARRRATGRCRDSRRRSRRSWRTRSRRRRASRSRLRCWCTFGENRARRCLARLAALERRLGVDRRARCRRTDRDRAATWPARRFGGSSLSSSGSASLRELDRLGDEALERRVRQIGRVGERRRAARERRAGRARATPPPAPAPARRGEPSPTARRRPAPAPRPRRRRASSPARAGALGDLA